jgi:ribose transport system substrate-binding protein
LKTDVVAQTQAVQDLLKEGHYDGIGISPINPIPQAVMLADVASNTTLVTFDSDSPVARRLCFVGTDNYAAGRHLAEYAKQAMPDGGDVIVVMGFADKENTQRRRQGVIDELLDRSFEPQRPTDEFEQPIKGERYNIVATIVDEAKSEVSTQLAVEAIQKNPNLKCFVGLLAYSTPALLEALKQTDKLGKIQIVGFDVQPQTLDAIDAGHVYATVMQDQFGLGFHTVRILAENARGFKMGLPTFQVRSLPTEIVTKTNLAAVREQLKQPTTRPSTS